MTNRRDFLRTTAAVSALGIPTLMPRRADAISARAPAVQLHLAIFDGRYAEGHVYGQAVAEQGVSARSLDAGDVTSLYRELDLLWRERPVAVAGLTQWGPLFVLERLASERGVALAADIRSTVGEPQLLPGVPGAEQPSFVHYYTPLAFQQGYGVAVDGPLYSWVIAPPARG